MRILFLLFTFLPLWVYAQKTQTFIYGIKTIENKDSKMDEMINSVSPNYKNLVTDIRFNLVIKKDSSCFYLDKKTIPDDDGVDLFLALLNSSEKIFQTKDSIFEEVNLEHHNKKYILKDTINSHWSLLNEKKSIMGYACYKATCVKTVINEVGIFKNDIIAWYCPELPYQFGPYGYGKLPGLIFELQTKKALFGIQKINLDAEDKLPQINKILEFVSYKQLNENILKLRDERKKMMGSQN